MDQVVGCTAMVNLLLTKTATFAVIYDALNYGNVSALVTRNFG
jgi:hypothetical protein